MWARPSGLCRPCGQEVAISCHPSHHTVYVLVAYVPRLHMSPHQCRAEALAQTLLQLAGVWCVCLYWVI
jgi:hypothetical protein